jgi:hypothetical protein
MPTELGIDVVVRMVQHSVGKGHCKILRLWWRWWSHPQQICCHLTWLSALIIVVNIMIHEGDTDLHCDPSTSLYPQKWQGVSGGYSAQGSDIDEALENA